MTQEQVYKLERELLAAKMLLREEENKKTKELLDNFVFKVGDAVAFEGKFKGLLYARVEKVFYEDSVLKVIVRETPRWQKGAARSFTDFSKLTKVTPKFDSELNELLSEQKGWIESEIEALTKTLKEDLENTEKLIEQNRLKCVHLWEFKENLKMKGSLFVCSICNGERIEEY